MGYGRYVVRRAAFALASLYAVVTATFLLVTLLLDDALSNRVSYAVYCKTRNCPGDPPTPEQMREGFVSARNLDVPLVDRYVGWLVDVVTLEWGYSFAYGRPIDVVVGRRIPATLEYVVPGVVLAIGLGVLAGVLATFLKDTPVDWSVRIGAYVLLGIPSFALLFFVDTLSGQQWAWPGIPLLNRTSVAALAVAASLVAGQLRFTRTATLEESGKAFVKMLRAKGVDRLRLGRHVLRNASLPIVSQSMSAILAVLMLDIYVIESVLGIEGLAKATLRGAKAPDMALVIWTTMVIATIGIVGNFLQDVCYAYLDPTIREG